MTEIENQETCGFVLRTSDIVDSSGTAILGSINGISNNVYGSSYTWFNINIKQILGNLWDKYDYFNLSLIAVPIASLYTYNLVSHDKFSTIYMRGLQWNNCNFAYVTKHFNNKACIGMVTMLGTSVVPYIDVQSGNIGNCFSKSSPITDITIDLYSIVSDIPAIPSNYATLGCIYPQFNLMFSINPIKKDERFSNIYLRTKNDTIATNNGVVITWKGYDLKQAIGDMWDDYDIFNICLVEAYTSAVSATFTSDNKVGIINLSGLPFINPPATNTNIGIIDLNLVNATNNTMVKNYDINTIQFTKYFPVVDLTISMKQLISDSLIATPGTLTLIDYVFKVTGVNKFDT